MMTHMICHREEGIHYLVDLTEQDFTDLREFWSQNTTIPSYNSINDWEVDMLKYQYEKYARRVVKSKGLPLSYEQWLMLQPKKDQKKLELLLMLFHIHGCTDTLSFEDATLLFDNSDVTINGVKMDN